MAGLVPSYERWVREQQAIRESTRERRGFVLGDPGGLLGSEFDIANRRDPE